ncbi:MAG: hypothetical protein IJT27_00560 [Clostridia bacterium]|nr:hypothetical protein [Clostridia bacterium]
MKKEEIIQTETVFIPKTSKNDDALFVAVNGRRLLVKKGEAVQLPAPFAEVIRHSFDAEKQAQAYIDAVGGKE